MPSDVRGDVSGLVFEQKKKKGKGKNTLGRCEVNAVPTL